MSALAEALDLYAQLTWRRTYNRLDYYQPYGFQEAFHNARGFQSNQPAQQKCLMAGNGVGKTWCGATETAIHLTGRYPDWWRGARFRGPVEVVCGGKTNDTVVKVVQKELFGDPLDDTRLGTGSIPHECIVVDKITRKVGVPNAYQDALIRHVSGGFSKVTLMAYEQKAKAFMGIRFDVGWMDEEPPLDIWSQFIRGTISRREAILYVTFTPEEGLTDVVNQFMNDLRPGQALIQATWDDAEHISEAEKNQREMALPAHEREMRRRGVPQFGAGLVFPFGDDLVVDPMPIPRHWKQLIGIDFGWDHPFGAVKLVLDSDADVIYVTNDYRESRATPAIHAAAIRPWGKWPVAWPHDGLNSEKGTGIQLRDAYVEEGLDLLPSHATHAPQFGLGQKEGEGGYSVEAGIQEMYARMETQRWKVFRTCRYWLEEQRIYHRDKDAKLVKLRDDVISASRIAYMMRRFAIFEHVRVKRKPMVVGPRNW